MAEAPEGMEIFTVMPNNYDKIIERSKSTPKPYSREDLEQMRARAYERNTVALVMFMAPDFWERGRG